MGNVHGPKPHQKVRCAIGVCVCVKIALWGFIYWRCKAVIKRHPREALRAGSIISGATESSSGVDPADTQEEERGKPHRNPTFTCSLTLTADAWFTGSRGLEITPENLIIKRSYSFFFFFFIFGFLNDECYFLLSSFFC